MQAFRSIGLDDADRVVGAVVSHAREGGYRGIAVVVVDKMAEVIAGRRMDGLAGRYFQSAYRKAYTAAAFERDTLAVRDFWNDQGERGHRGPADWNDSMLTTLPGGLCVVFDGEVVGGIGVAGGGASGDFSDEAFALVGLRALGEGFGHRARRERANPNA
jgi:uncharacterized protein GlcG (DUF336 family)